MPCHRNTYPPGRNRGTDSGLLVWIHQIHAFMVTAMTPRHPARSRCQNTLLCIDDRTHPLHFSGHLILRPDTSARKVTNMAVDIDGLPVRFGHRERFVVYGKMRILLGVLVPPLPGLGMVLRVRKLVQTLDVAKVVDGKGLVTGGASIGIEPAGLAQHSVLFALLFERFYHVGKIHGFFPETRRQDTKWVVVAGADVEDHQVFVSWLATIIAFGIWDDGGELLHQNAVHELVAPPTHCHEEGVQRAYDQVDEGRHQRHAP